MLTVLIPCKNERHNIEACVASARQLDCEILVADSGSTDGTLTLVRQMPDCRLIQREFVNFASFKNWAIPQAARPWVLVLDADERITPELAEEIRQTLASTPADVDAYWIGRRTFMFGREARFGPWLNDGVVRLIRRDVCRYDDHRVHEGMTIPRRRLRRLRHKLLHFSIADYDAYFAKYVNYTRWGAADRWDRGVRTSLWQMLLRPFGRFLWLYLVRGGFLDGALGVQTCMLQAFFVTFVKQGRLWELEQQHIAAGEEVEPIILPFPTENLPSPATSRAA